MRSSNSYLALKKIALMMLAFMTWQFSGFYFIEEAYARCSSKPVQSVNWAGCRKRNLILSGLDLRNGNFRQADFASTDMRETKIDGANFVKAVLIRAVFDNASARKTVFEKAVGTRSSFRNSDLSGAVFRKSELLRVDFSGSILTGVDFSKSNAGRALFDGARMENNNFSFANIARADFRKAVMIGRTEFKGAYLFQTRFEGVDLTKSVGLQQWQINMTCGDQATLLPENLKNPTLWHCGIQ